MDANDRERARYVCAECGREPRPGETWRLHFADIGVVIYCPECAEREFGDT